jgi:hypothetical protein
MANGPEYRLGPKNELSRYSKYDFAQPIKPQSDFLGFIEPDYQRLKVYFDSIIKSKTRPNIYTVKGATVVKNNRCDFMGTIRFTQIREYRSATRTDEDEYKSQGILKHGIAIGAFRFEEDPKQKHVGVFEGTMLLYWYLDRNGTIRYDDIEIGADAYRNNQYVSTWTQYGSKTGKRANWGEYRIPLSGDLDIGDGEFLVNPKYLDNGWREYSPIADDDLSAVLGDWSGTSLCVDKKKFPACKDETVVYHITRVAGKSDIVNLSADKIVNGKPEFMGAFDFVYDAKKQTLTSEFQNSRTHIIMEFLMKGDVLEGTMIDLPARSLVRRMMVKKNK